MTHPGAEIFPPSALDLARDVDLLILDVDGVMTDGRLYYGDSLARGGPSRSPAEGSLPARGDPSRSPAEGSLPARGDPSRSPAEGSLPARGDPSRSPAEGSLPARGDPSRSPAEGSLPARGDPSRSPAEGSLPARGDPSRSPAEGSLPARGDPSRSPAEGSLPARGDPSRSPAEGSLPARGDPSRSPAEGSLPARGDPSRSPAEGSEIKAFYAQDGAAIKMLQAAGIPVAIITGRASEATARRAWELGIAYAYQGVEDKTVALSALCCESGISSDRMAHAGDDIPDLPLFDRVGMRLSVPHAHPEVAARADYVTAAAAGAGAVREICHLILIAKGLWESALTTAGAGRR